MKNKYSLVFFLCLSFQLLSAQQVTLSLVATIDAPTDIKNAGDKRMFIVDRGATIRIIDSSGALQARPFLNISDRVLANSEQGLLGLAFDPGFKDNGFFYVDYTRQPDGRTCISRFHLTGDPDHCDSGTEQVLLTIYQPFTNHNGGDVNFGPDGYLYIGMGDGGDAGDPGNRAQNLDSLLGKILRIDVSDSSVPYNIPPDNPLILAAKQGRGEIWDYGMRNPWRFSFDRMTGDLWIADVGQGNYEEIDREDSGSGGGFNYGWRCYEGDSTYNSTGCGSSSYTFPIYAYDHSNSNCSITGGYRYRGTQFPAFAGNYFFADYCVGHIRYLTETTPGVYTNTLTSASLQDITTFGEDMNGELYVGTIGGHGVYRICDTSCLTGMQEASVLSNLAIYPNPNDATFTLSFNNESEEDVKIQVSNMLGQKIFESTRSFNPGEHHIPMQLNPNLAAIYFLSLQTEEGIITRKVVVKQ